MLPFLRESILSLNNYDGDGKSVMLSDTIEKTLYIEDHYSV